MNPDSERPFVVVAVFTTIIPWAVLQAYILILAIQSGGFTPLDFLWGALLASIAGAGLALGLIRPK